MAYWRSGRNKTEKRKFLIPIDGPIKWFIEWVLKKTGRAHIIKRLPWRPKRKVFKSSK